MAREAEVQGGVAISKRIALVSSIVVLMVVFVCVAVAQRKAVVRKAAAIRPGMTLAEVMVPLDGWWMLNTHPAPRSGEVEYNGYSGDVYVLSPLARDGRETNLAKISRDQFTRELTRVLSGGAPWTVYFNYRTVPTDTGILVRFDGHGRVTAVGEAAASRSRRESLSRGPSGLGRWGQDWNRQPISSSTTPSPRSWMN